MVNILKKLSLFLLAVPYAFAAVDVSVSPQETDGTPVVVKFIIKDEDGEAEILKVPEDDGNWRISPPITQTAKSFRVNGLNMESTSSTTIQFFLHPLKAGQLKLPLIQIKLNEKAYSTPQTSIRVTKLRDQQNKQPRQPSIPGFPMFPLDENTDDVETPLDVVEGTKKLEVAIIPEPSKVQVYEGELIILPFYIYTNENIFRNLEFASFPTFKDFIKEELYLPKNWRTERVKYRGADYYKAEIIRFAIFPLKEGELLIDPLNMRFEIDDSLFSLRRHFPNSQTTEEQPNNFLRSSGAIPITVKPLPPKPANVTQSEIAVGKYTIQVTPPKSEITQNEAFTLTLRIEGQGNIKGIPEPEITLPEGLQKSKTATDYSINTLSEGYKEFDLLLVPRKSGTLSIPEKDWAFFNPDKKAYEVLKIPSVELKIIPSNKNYVDGTVPQKAQDLVYSGKQSFEKLGEADLPFWAWGLPALLYAFAGVLFVQRRKQEQEDLLIANQPWVLIERKIYAQHDLKSNEALGLVEEWILQRFKVLKFEEAAFEDLAEALRKKTPPSTEPKVEKLKEKFKLIESTRFSSARKTNNLNLSFAEIKKLSEEIILATSNYVAPSPSDEEDEDM